MIAMRKRWLGLSRRGKIGLAASGVLLVSVIIAGAVLTGSPLLAARLAHSMTGATQQSGGYGPIKYGGKCLTVTTEWLWQAGKYQVRLWECDSSNPGTQQWKYMTDGQSYIIAKASPLGEEVCLDVEGASKTNGGTITTFQCIRGAPNLNWNILGLGFLDQVTGEGIKLQNVNSQMCMTSVDNSAHPWMVQRPCEEVSAFWTWAPNYLPNPKP